MSLDKDLLSILCCPQTKQPVRLAEPDILARVNQAIRQGTLLNVGRKPVTEELQSGLIRSDNKVVYPVREDIPVMLIDEGISLEVLA